MTEAPTRFEDEFPVAGQALMDICEGREKGQCLPIIFDYHPAHPYSIENGAGIPIVKEPKIGRNDPCPCGSGKKYKKCCSR